MKLNIMHGNIGHFGAVHKALLFKGNTSGQSHMAVVAVKMIKGNIITKYNNTLVMYSLSSIKWVSFVKEFATKIPS